MPRKKPQPKPAKSITVEALPLEDRPNAIALVFEGDDEDTLSPQQVLDALADYLIYVQGTTLLDRRGKGH
jgi:hypothetical protein